MASKGKLVAVSVKKKKIFNSTQQTTKIKEQKPTINNKEENS